jgi:excinuclease ABC subunit A
VGVSGSGKSSLVFDTVYNEARRRFLETLALGSPWLRMPPANVRRITGLGPAVSIAQNVLNRNPSSTVASSTGMHPFFRILYARFADVACPRCTRPVRALSDEERLTTVLDLLAAHDGEIDVEVPLVRGLAGSHERLLTGARDLFDRVVVDGRPWRGRALDPDSAHDIRVRVGRLGPGDSPADVRALLERADAVGSAEVLVAGRSMSSAPACPECGAWVRPLEPAAFQPGAADTSSHRIAGTTFEDLMTFTIEAAAGFVDDLAALTPARRIQHELERRLRPLLQLGLGYLTLDRPMPTLSRGEAQRTRLAVVLAGRLEDLLHVLDEPTIGLHHTDLARLLDAIAGLPGPVVMVEHDRTAIAMADDVIEIGPGGGQAGGRLVFQGPPAALWKADTPSGRSFSTNAPITRIRRERGTEAIRIAGANARNLTGFECEVPLGLLTVVTGPSGAGKTTLLRDVLLASLTSGDAQGCAAIDAPRLRAIAVDQAPLGNNPRSNPATYTKVFDRIRTLFAHESGRSASEFTFNRPEGACEECEGMGAIEVKLPYVASTWITCDACDGTRYRPESLTVTWSGRSISDVLDCSVDEACDLFAADRTTARALHALQQVGLGYVKLGQPSPSLSGGEAQRVRLARRLTRAKAGDLVLLDEPTTGLHPADLARLIAVLDGLTATGCTVVVVEHQPDLIAAADWIIDLGPGGGPAGGHLLHCGPPAGGVRPDHVPPRAEPRARPRATDAIRIEGARAHNLRSVDVAFRKGAFTVVTGVSGSGKSSLVGDVLAAEASRRLLECLSVYERQSAHEGPEAPVDAITGLGPTLIVDSNHTSGGEDRGRATVGRSSELDRLVAVLLARSGERRCLECGGVMRRTAPAAEAPWRCEDCGTDGVPIEPRHLVGSPLSFCRRCLGRGFQRTFLESKLIRRPEEPVCGRCLHSPGYYPKSYMCTPGTGLHPRLLAFADRHGFDPYSTPWAAMSETARQTFIWGDPEPFDDGALVNQLDITLAQTEKGWMWRGLHWLAFNDIGGMYSEGGPCGKCNGRRLRPEYLAIHLGGHDRADLFSMPFVALEDTLAAMPAPSDPVAADALGTIRRRLRFLRQVGLGYLHLDRASWTLSAGEAQRVKLASVLGGGLLGMTVLLDEPSRGLHPREVAALTETLAELRDAGNTVIAVEHDPVLIRAADQVVEVGPGAGRRGGRIVDISSDESVTRPLLGGDAPRYRRRPLRSPSAWMHVRGARENNLRGEDVAIPLGVLVGVCGVSGSGKSSLVVDTVGLALAPPKVTTSIASRDRIEAGAHDGIDGAPKRVLVADQAREAVVSAGSYLGIVDALRRVYASSDVAESAGITEADIKGGCDLCRGRGSWRERMWFLPAVTHACDACGGTGYRREAASLVVRGHTLADLEALTLDEVAGAFGDVPAVGRVCDAAARVGLGYLVVRQPGWSLSGGEAQRLKLAKELGKRATARTLYLLDEPTVGLHVNDVGVLVTALDEVVASGSTVLVVEHHPDLLAACDWLIELGPGAGPDGGRVIFTGTPEDLAAAGTPTSPYMKEALP